MFDLLLQPNPDEGNKIRPLEELIDEAFLLLFAGSDTTAYTLSCATYYLLTHKDCLRRLQNELETVSRDANGKPDWKSVSELPYLVFPISPPFPRDILTEAQSNLDSSD